VRDAQIKKERKKKGKRGKANSSRVMCLDLGLPNYCNARSEGGEGGKKKREEKRGGRGQILLAQTFNRISGVRRGGKKREWCAMVVFVYC